ncbi:hypothetical protein HanXRQr2_Chr04g0162051 [Helianthus annuus]|uniref:Uncharacterized protein n=1 Tax=Helianthus annuus TaxID=4232 RepID=A0A251VIG4_HELAN|nr:uncharacterized protein LOC110927088 [Helianthus annuus]KAF5809830.1 hypothetical protein HanXRQr2_Chr04g0162051 [Helianthus annuus]KAJ0580791.1 hypothetical protein HanHA300_Chr04g0133411 [Helianthus annuus]KAJ0588486.1 hypothetical protein HanIR_Chr04g0175191 [Helianthus annuus]KAJ0757413.1 hypothetical protein HanLR1_Chr04g0138421 [Helianthus annuus]KAJ0761113.1 hypothetical protein HanOQP8_Chr04g0145961 [Helianthus annuus]
MASSSSSNHKQKHVGSKSTETEEIVKYMSNLPSYLERGKPVQDRALNFGVLDWGRLEQWQYHNHKQSNRSSLHSHLNISTQDILSKDAPVSHSSRSRTKPRGVKKNDLNVRDLAESRSSDDTGSFQSASSSLSSNGKMKIRDELVIKIGNFQDSCNGSRDGTKHSDLKTDAPNSLPLKNEIVSKKNSKNETDSKRKTSIACQTKTPEEKEFSIAASKSRFSFNMSSKSAVVKSATKTLESPLASQNPPEDLKTKAKVKMDLGSCKEVRVDYSCRNKTNESSTSSSSSSSSRKRALFQMAVKNGRPLFTFSVDDNKNDILAATVRSLAGKDDANSWVYTFFAVQEVKKKKSGWLSHSSKDKSNAYLPNVTAQMTVSNPLVYDDGTTREFVLSSVDSGQPDPDQQILDDQLEKELAAIVVRFLTKAGGEDDNQDGFSTTVILPGGHHSVPRKGEPSPLIERWRSGGRCDCGGWDVGCRLRTLANNVKSDTSLNPYEIFDLFLQGEVVNERPFFSLSPIKEGIFSVDYNASLPLLHAFSICISVIECRKSSHHTELRTYVAKRVDDVMVPVTYASLPPVSPVGRV